MFDLKKLEKLLNIKIYSNKINKKEKIKNEIKSEPLFEIHERILVWPIEVLPITKYIISGTPNNLSKIEEIMEIKVKNYNPIKLAEKIIRLDIYLINKVLAEDLLKYDGKIIPQSLAHIQNFNYGIFKWFITELEYEYLKIMGKRAIELKDYNLLNIIMQSMQYFCLNKREKKTVIHYKNILEKIDNGIWPFDLLLKDCADSNINLTSEIASLRFCKIIEKLKQMKEIKCKKISEKYKQYILGKSWIHLGNNIETNIFKKHEKNKLYLVI